MSRGRPRVAFCDDDPRILDLLRGVSEQIGVEPFVFSRPEDFLRNLGSIRPDVIVTDINMPDLDGFELVQLLKQNNIQVPFIFLTGHDSLENLRRGFVDGSFDFLSKPVRFSELKAAIDKALSFGPVQYQSEKLVLLIECHLAKTPAKTGS